MECHRSAYKGWKDGTYGKTRSFEIFDEYGLNNCVIVLLEAFPCNSKDEALAREAYHIKTLSCVNRNIPTRTRREYYDDNRVLIRDKARQHYQNNVEKELLRNKQYRESNRETVAETKKQWHIAHRETELERQKKYREENKVKILETRKKYYEANKDAINLKKREWRNLKKLQKPQ